MSRREKIQRETTLPGEIVLRAVAAHGGGGSRGGGGRARSTQSGARGTCEESRLHGDAPRRSGTKRPGKPFRGERRAGPASQRTADHRTQAGATRGGDCEDSGLRQG